MIIDLKQKLGNKSQKFPFTNQWNLFFINQQLKIIYVIPLNKSINLKMISE